MKKLYLFIVLITCVVIQSRAELPGWVDTNDYYLNNIDYSINTSNSVAITKGTTYVDFNGAIAPPRYVQHDGIRLSASGSYDVFFYYDGGRYGHYCTLEMPGKSETIITDQSGCKKYENIICSSSSVYKFIQVQDQSNQWPLLLGVRLMKHDASMPSASNTQDYYILNRYYSAKTKLTPTVDSNFEPCFKNADNQYIKIDGKHLYSDFHWNGTTSVIFDEINMLNAGTYTMTISANYPSSATVNIVVNGTQVATNVAPSTIDVNLNTGNNTIKIVKNNNWANIYYIALSHSATLTWNTDGATTITGGTPAGSVNYKSAISAPTVSKIGYTYAGWTPTVPATMPFTDATYTAQWTPNPNTPYKVEHYQQNLNLSGYTLVYTDNFTGTTASSVTPARKSYTGFTSPSGQTVSIAADGSTVVKYYYDRIKYTVTIAKNNNDYGTVSTSSIANVPYGTVISTSNNTINVNGTTVTATPATNTTQYTYSFTGWTNGTATVTGNTTVTADFTRTTNKYTITFKNEDGTTLQTGLVEYGQTPVYSGATPTKASTAQYTYIFDTWSPAIAAVTQAQVYTATYKSTLRSYTVTIAATPAGYGTVDVSSVADVPYGTTISTDNNTINVNGTTVTATPATTTSQFIYSFDSWTNGTATVQGDLTVTANFSRAANILQISEMATTPDWTEGETRDVQLTRTLITTGYNTLCLPFDVASDELSTFGEGVQLYTLSSVEQTDGVTLNFTSASSIVAGTPYLVEVTSANANPTFTSRTLASTTPGSTTQGNATFYGAYVQTELQTSDYFLGANNLLYHPIPSDRTIKGLRGYFTINAPAGTPIRVAINQPTNIVSPPLSGEGRGEATKIIKDNQLLIIRDGKTYNAQGIRQ